MTYRGYLQGYKCAVMGCKQRRVKGILLASTGYHCAAISLNSKGVQRGSGERYRCRQEKFYRLGFELGISKERSRRQAVHIKEEFGVMPAFSIDLSRTDGVQSINVCFVLEEIRNYPRNSKYATTAVVKKSQTLTLIENLLPFDNWDPVRSLSLFAKKRRKNEEHGELT